MTEQDKAVKRWKTGLDQELAFWEDWATNNLESLNGRLKPDAELHPYLKKYIDPKGKDTIRVLDVGAGPITYLGSRWSGYNLEITAIDPLADEYNEMLRKHNIARPVTSIYGEAEKLDEQFPPNTFDLAYSFNALDHSRNPVEGVCSVLQVLKSGAYFLLRTFVNEGENQKYTGLHQWNFCECDRRLFIWRPGEEHDMNALLESLAEITFIGVKPNLWERDMPRPILWVDLRKLS